MKKTVLFLSVICLLAVTAFSQNYDHALNYAHNGTPAYGVKIKTNLPFTSGTQMPTISIQGFNYSTGVPIDLKIVYYIFAVNSVNTFIRYGISSSGGYTPPVYLSVENGKVIIYINDRSYFQRFTVDVFSQGISGESSSWFQGWTVADEPNNGTNTVLVPYLNRFSGNVYMPGNGLWNPDGNVGIGTLTPREKLSVNGKIRAQEVKVETANWPDYVFTPTHRQIPLPELEQYIQANRHLPEIPSAAQAEKEGISLGEMNAKLVKKIEELTLYLIEKDKEIQELKQQHSEQDQEKEIGSLKQQLEALTKEVQKIHIKN